MKLHFLKSEKFKTNIICLLIRRSLEHDEVSKNSLIANILKNGSADYPSIREINNITEEMFGSIFDIQIVKKGEEQVFQFYFEFLAFNQDLLFKGFEFLYNLIYNPLTENNAFKESYFRLEKEILKQIIESRVNNKTNYAKERCIELMCKKERFGINADGYVEDLEKINNEDLLKHYKNILENSPMELIVLGNFEKAEIDELYKKFNFPENRTKLPKAEIIFEKSELKRHIEYLNVIQNKICIGIRLNGEPNGEKFYKMLLLNEILGGGSSSLLFRKVRDEENLCYYIHSVLYRFKSIILIESGIDNTEKAESIIVKQIENISNGEFSEDDVNEAKKSLIKKYNSIKDKQSATLDFYISNYLADENAEIDEIIEKIQKTEYNGVLDIAKDMYIDTVYYLMDGEAD